MYQKNELLQASPREDNREDSAEHVLTAMLIDENRILKKTLDALDYPVLVINAADYRIELANNSAHSNETCLSTCFRLHHKQEQPCSSESYPCPLDEMRLTKQPVITEHVHYLSDGSIQVVEIRAYPILDEAGDLQRMVECTHDITSSRQQESQQLHVRVALEQLHETLHVLSSSSDEVGVGQTILEAAAKILQSDMCALELTTLQKRFFHPAPPEPEAGININFFDNSLAAQSLASGRTFLIDMEHSIPRSVNHDPGPSGGGAVNHPPRAWQAVTGFQVGVSMPIKDRGCFQAIWTHRFTPSVNQLRLLELLLSYGADALARIDRQSDLERKALIDPLTQVFNRHHLEEVLDRETTRATRYGHVLGLMMVDVNDFKKINDRFGHLKGDRLLRILATLIQDEVRESDMVFRIGGDEFLVLFPEAGPHLDIVAARLQEKIATMNSRQSFGLESYPVSISNGTAYWNPSDSKPIEEAISLADQKMYTNKHRLRFDLPIGSSSSEIANN